MPNFIKTFCICFLLASGVTVVNGDTPEPGVVVSTLMDKITLRVDMRLQTVNGGVYVAGNFFDQIGLPNWTEIAMCDLGDGIWEISLTGITPGLYQYKFLNGFGGWEFNGFGGPCTNPNDNENRWLDYGGGVHVEGPWCFSTCDLFCPPLGDPGATDTDPPTIDEPAPVNTTIQCGDPLPNGATLDASDGCNINVTTETGTPSDDLSGLSACGVGDVIRSWEAEDCAGNTSSVTQTITIEDTTNPTIDVPVPADLTVECGNLPAAASLAASDGCDTDVTTTGLPTDDNSGLTACGTGQIIRTWEVEDCSGNSVSASQTITIEDDLAPTINESIPADITVECGSIPAAQPLDASDDCDTDVTSTGLPTDDISGLSSCGTGEIIRTWEVMDCSGNAVSASQTITVEDGTSPVLSGGAPPGVTVTCGNVPTAVALAVSDDCDNTITSTGLPIDDMSGIGPCGTGQISRSWSVFDCTGNSLSVFQTINVEDNTAPEINVPVPANTTLQCGEPLPVAMPLSASDACDLNVTSTGPPVDDLSNITTCGTGDVIRTWEVSDCSGNTTTVSQTITFEDAEDPIIVDPIPADVIVDCNNIPVGVPLTAADGCDQNLAATDFPFDDMSGLSNCGLGTIVRTWTTTDCSGNMTTGTQLITIADDQPPFLTQAIPADVTVTCGNVPVGLPLSAADDCDGILVATDMPVDDNSGLNSCGTGVIVRSWTATDCSGNVLFETQAITVTDEEPPVLTIPGNASLDCNNIPTASAADASATDNCSTASISYNGETIVGAGCPYEIHRTWSAEDECGNTSSATQIITVTDNDSPTLATPPPDITVCAGALPGAADLNWTDNCDGTGSVSPTDVSDGMNDPETITRTWTYSDNCGNTANVSQIITVISAPSANAGDDLNLCEGAVASLSGSVAGGFNSLLWTSSGNGTFGDETSENTDYSPSIDDFANGSVTIYFTAQTNGVGACSETSDSLTLNFIITPSANAGADQSITCATTQVALNGSGSSSGPGYAYEWSGPGIHAMNINEQNPLVDETGTYVLTVIDTLSGQSCSATDSVEVFENTAEPTADAGADMTLTCAETSVVLDGTGSSAGPALVYLWSGAGITAANENLPNPAVSEGGIYTLTVTDTLNGCFASDHVEVQLDGNLPTADAGPNQIINCNHDAVVLDGSNSSVGAGIEYQWFDPNGMPLGTELTQTVSQGGIYSFEVSDTNNGCEITATVEVVTDTELPTADAGVDATLTCDESSVELGGSSSSGAIFSYVWILQNDTVGTDETLIATQSGIYTLLIVNNQNGCFASDEVAVSQNADLPTAEAGDDQQLDCGNTAVFLDGSGSSSGTGITYLWTGPNFSSAEISPQVGVAGIYYLTVVNTNSACEAIDSVEVTADADLPVADAGIDTLLNCYASQILLDGNNSTQGAGIEYEWQDEFGNVLGTTLTLSVDQPAVYTLFVNNTQNGCSSSDGITVGLDDQSPVADAGTDMQFTCTQTTLTLDGTGSTVGTDIVYEWNGPGISGPVDQLTATAVEAGIYTLSVTNTINGCTAIDEVEVTQNPDVPTAFAENDQHFDCFTDVVDLSGSASVPQVTYQWSGPGINASNENLEEPEVSEPGIYSLVVTDLVTGCESPPAVVEILDLRTPPLISLAVSDNLDCQTMSVLIDGSGSEQGDTIAYQWLSGGNVLSTGPDDFWMANEAGFYTLVVFNSVTGCISEDSIEVVDESALPPVLVDGPTTVNCANEIITLSEIASPPNATYAWSTNNGNILQEDQNEIQVNAAGQYLVEVTDPSNGCTNTFTFSVQGDFTPPSIQFINDFSIGCSQTEVMLSAEVIAGTNDLTYTWNGNGFSSSDEMPTVTQIGDYELVVTDNINGCSSSALVTVSQSNGIENVFFTAISPSCFGAEDGVLQIDSVWGANLPYSLSWNNTTTTDPYLNGLASGSYSVLLADAAGCEMMVDFTLQDPPVLAVDLGPDVEISLGESIQLSPSVSASVLQYIWSGTETLSCDDCPDPIAQPTTSTTYTLTVASDNDCLAEDEILVTVNGDVDIYRPNAFSPNGDGINDVFTLFGGSQLQNMRTFLVFDRWGAKVFDGKNLAPSDPNYGWNGTHNGQLMDAGVYVFYVEIEMANGEVVTEKGEVMLIR
ncbi:MAG: gliding motility-associated C-terminal domain-containing protein [Bacteroidota bacterium]